MLSLVANFCSAPWPVFAPPLTGMKLVRATKDGNGILGTVTWVECARRVSRMAKDLDAIGATTEAAAFRGFRSQNPIIG